MGTALLFSGQGSQYPGMGKKFYDHDENPQLYEDIFAEGSDILGFDLKKTMFEGSEAELAVTAVSQPTIFTMSLICAEKLLKDGGSFDAAAGHSLGEYAALVLAGSVSRSDGFTLIKHRAACMDKAAKKNGGKMAAIIGLPPEDIENACREINDAGDYVTAVNYNTPVQTVIAGSDAGIEKACSLLKERGAKRALPLKVAAAFHSGYMKEAAEEFRELISGIEIKPPQKAFYSNVTGARLTDEEFSGIHELLARHIFSPVRFTSELAAMSAAGIDSFIECGPGKTLAGMVAKTLKDASARSMDA